jgi:hypothetical protein
MWSLRIKLTPPSGLRPCPHPPPLGHREKGGNEKGEGEGKEGRDGGEREGSKGVKTRDND